ncbi:MAG: response regulator [Sphingopyxis sp.]|uniref:response regulator transcription factor n=1 Tax=Sphingopyxis sp. TaxID=1908224 RepID=UPI001A1B7BB5|nr:response regulator [Sphingopyxis sp.]MBJ7498745.1 response regulator [Sphingopyxis sp.]
MPRTPLVAVVDDDEAIREALCDLLMVTGLSCSTFDSASAFLNDDASPDIDCLITDVRMPGMSGLDMLEHMRATGSDLPVIVLTSVLDASARARALELGAQAWLTKPVADDALLDELRSAIGEDQWPDGPER